MQVPIVVTLDEAESFPLAGGKGANLARLRRAGFRVPGGFVVSTAAYLEFIEANDLEQRILELAGRTSSDDPQQFETASSAIRELFAGAILPPRIADDIRDAYRAMASPAVAVRSSATTEDRPDLSFAGQQETYLNVIGEERLVDAVVRCWSSLWTARAIGYRRRNEVGDRGVAIAVVVQEMVNAEAAGVLFTANPLTGNRAESVIDATFGLGEALVSGHIEPDHFVVDRSSVRIIRRTLGSKSIAVRSAPKGGMVTELLERKQVQALEDRVVVELTRTGEEIEKLLEGPQDIEWAYAAGTVFILQSRPITTLFPLPEGMPPEPLQVLLSLGHIQGMLDPFTPLGQEMFLHRLLWIFARYVLGTDRAATATPLVVAGERLFFRITPILGHPHARKRFLKALNAVEPGTARLLEQIAGDAKLLARPTRIPFGLALRLSWRASWVLTLVTFNLLFAPVGRRRLSRKVESWLDSLALQATNVRTLAQGLAFVRTAMERLPRLGFGYLAPGVVSGVGSLVVLRTLTADLPDPDSALEVTRALPHNVTTEMNLALWNSASLIKNNPEVRQHLEEGTAELVAEELRAGTLPRVAQVELERFLDQYGMRGVAEIDLGRRRWQEDPVPVIRILRSYLQIDEASSPAAAFERGADQAARAARAIVGATRARHGRLRAALVAFFANRVRQLAGLRETPKFTIIRVFSIVRQVMLRLGRSLNQSSPEDIFFLRLSELERLAQGEIFDWMAIVSERRVVYSRERRRRQVPRILLSDGRAFFEGIADERGAIVGSPVSAGTAEGIVHVVHDPSGVQLAPGEILVCRGTDPAWTPLFLTAGGLVMEVGGLMTHGSVVAREHGIPAVAGVDRATERLQNGQKVRVDGFRGVIIILEETSGS